MNEKPSHSLHYGWTSNPTCHSINGWKNPKLTPLCMKLQHYRPGHQWMKEPQTDYIMDAPPSTHTRITAWENLTELVHLWRNLQHPPTKAPMGVKTPNWLCQGWTSSTSPIRKLMDENIPKLSSFKFEPPSDHKRTTRWRKSQTKLVPFWMNLQHRNQKNNTVGEKNPKLSSFKDEPPSNHKRITGWKHPRPR